MPSKKPPAESSKMPSKKSSKMPDAFKEAFCESSAKPSKRPSKKPSTKPSKNWVDARSGRLSHNLMLPEQPQNEARQDEVCFLKVLIDAYHSNTRSSTTEVRKQLARLDIYMKVVARGDVIKLCTHTRSLLYDLNAAGETTQDLITNLISAMQRAPDSNFW
jgi:hypothetical protein